MDAATCRCVLLAWGVGSGLAGCASKAGEGAPALEAGPVLLEARGLSSLDRAGLELLPRALVDLDPPALSAEQIPAFDRPHLGNLSRTRSYSIGTASRGYLVQARALPDGLPHLQARPVSVARKAIWGTDELVGALTRSAAVVARDWPGSVLYAGDLSAEHGGDVAGHASHASGRDADLAFYVRDDAGMLADRPSMEPISDNGRALGASLWFDAARNWALVQALLTDPGVQVQWIFVASHLEALLLAHAQASGAEPRLIARAEAVLKEPVDSSRHMEHFHLRVYCALEERVEGCLDYGRLHPWVDTYGEALARRVAEVLPLLDTGRPEEVAYAVTRLVRLRARDVSDRIAALAAHPDPSVARLAQDAAAFLRGERTPPEWAHLHDEDPGE